MKEKFMNEALKESIKALNKNEVPIGAVIVKNDKIIAKSYNKKIEKNSPIAHAEISAIIKAAKKIKDWRLNDCEMYVTLEPCAMCMAVINESRIKRIYYLIESNYPNQVKETAKEQLFDLTSVNADKYRKLLASFFQNKR